MNDKPATTPSIDDIIAKILADPSASAITMCEQEDKLIAAEAEIIRLRSVLAAPATPVFTAAAHDDRYWLDRTIGDQTSVMVHGPFRCLADACIRANDFNRENFGLGSADA